VTFSASKSTPIDLHTGNYELTNRLLVYNWVKGDGTQWHLLKPKLWPV